MSYPKCHFETEGRKWQVTSSQIIFDREMLETQGCSLLTAVYASISTSTHPRYRPCPKLSPHPHTSHYALAHTRPAYLACVDAGDRRDFNFGLAYSAIGETSGILNPAIANAYAK